MGGKGVFFIAGPTASGKSAAALDLARSLDGEIVNADAMQVYSDLRVVTARPSAEEEERAPHHLYGVLDGAERCSAGRWAQMAAQVIDEICARGRSAIIVGGTGLYFRALEEGLSPIPEIPADIREQGAKRREEIGPEAFREEVVARDPAMAHLAVGDAQRQIRAWEVFEATGERLSAFQEMPRQPLLNAPVLGRAVIAWPREALYARCDARAAMMLEEGAIDEVRTLTARGLDPDLPIMKALGVPELQSFIGGAISQDEALSALQQSTRRFAKRQTTWFRNQAADWPRAQNPEETAAIMRPDAA